MLLRGSVLLGCGAYFRRAAFFAVLRAGGFPRRLARGRLLLGRLPCGRPSSRPSWRPSWAVFFAALAAFLRLDGLRAAFLPAALRASPSCAERPSSRPSVAAFFAAFLAVFFAVFLAAAFFGGLLAGLLLQRGGFGLGAGAGRPADFLALATGFVTPPWWPWRAFLLRRRLVGLAARLASSCRRAPLAVDAMALPMLVAVSFTLSAAPDSVAATPFPLLTCHLGLSSSASVTGDVAVRNVREFAACVRMR